MAKLPSNKDFEEIISLIESAKDKAFQKVNEELVRLYFVVGNIVHAKLLDGVWGDNTVGELANYIKNKIGGFSGFTRRGLYRMRQFYETYSSADFFDKIGSQLNYFLEEDKSSKVSALPTQIDYSTISTERFLTQILCKINWSNHLEILSQTKSAEEKLFYLLHCIKEKWSMRELRRQLSSGFFERTMLSDKKLQPARHVQQSFFRDPYIFEFLDLPDIHSEKDLEKALILNLRKFILEIGKGFTYMGNQFRLQVGIKDYFTDLLFYNRDLQCLVLFELKIQEFEPEFLGKLNFYLEALDRDIKRPFENNSIGVLLCKGKDKEVVEYAMARNTSPAIVADYETKLIPKKVLANKLHQLIHQLAIDSTK